MTYAYYQSPELSDTDIESLEFSIDEAESFEYDMETRLEDVSPDSVAATLQNNFGEPNGATMRVRPSITNPSLSVNKRMLKTFTIITKKLVMKIMLNPRTRSKLQDAIRQGPDAVTQLILPSVTNLFPIYLRWLPAQYVPSVVRVLFNPIRMQAGVKPEEVVGAEWSIDY